MSSTDILPARPGEVDEERRLREALNRHLGQAISTIDAAIALRTAPSNAQRMRHLARGHLVDAALKAMHAFTVSRESKNSPAE